MTDQSGTAELVQAKEEMRRILLLARAVAGTGGAGEGASAQACARVREVVQAGVGQDLPQVVLSGYMAMRGELDPLAVMESHPGPVCVPVVRGKGQALEFHRWTPGGAMVEGAFKAMIPAERDLLVPEVLIVPLLAFDQRGYRLGYGGGFYDRTLEGLRAKGPVLTIGFGYDQQEVETVPVEATDQRLDLIVTPERVIRPE